ncbi:MAG: caspase family protein [Planctomycetota bacterium]|nr:caspase family protein [Planctomycetota bacterium]
MKRAWIAVLMVTTAACASTAEAPDPPPKFEPILPYRLKVAVPEIAFDREKLNTEPSRHYSVESDPATIQQALMKSLREQGPFSEISPLAAAKNGDDAMGRAAGEGADLLLEIRIRKRLTSFLGGNGLYVPNLFVWFMAWIPSWWVRDETYSLDIVADVKLRSVHSGAIIHSETHRVKWEQDLDDFERGWQFLGIFRVPASLVPENWMNVDRTLAPDAEARLARRVATSIGQQIQQTSGTPEFQRAFARRYALVIGVSRFADYRIHNVMFADKDATAFYEHLTGPGGNPVHNTTLLLNGQATLPEIRAALKGFVDRGITKDDEILIYFAGYGAWSNEAAYVLPYDADSERIEETAYRLDELAQIAGDGEGPRITLVLDCPFVTRFQGRAAEEENTADLQDALTDFLGASGRIVISACNLGDACVELEDIGQGLFTYYLIRGLKGQGDGNKDGNVTWDEAYAFADRMTSAHANLEGKVQRPSLYRGSPNGEPGEEEVR